MLTRRGYCKQTGFEISQTNGSMVSQDVLLQWKARLWLFAFSLHTVSHINTGGRHINDLSSFYVFVKNYVASRGHSLVFQLCVSPYRHVFAPDTLVRIDVVVHRTPTIQFYILLIAKASSHHSHAQTAAVIIALGLLDELNLIGLFSKLRSFLYRQSWDIIMSADFSAIFA